ncbi:hypothetical protein F4780DRAFT_718309 [Xylariomycetidae sp. FL0641]|nr:hypothetical protein F4780DRAFT_718309 [Xylariomycetidae sp. FL0641]
MSSPLDFSDPFHPLERSKSYEFTTEVAPSVWKVYRRLDRAEFLAHDMTELLQIPTAADPNATEEETGLAMLLYNSPDTMQVLTSLTEILNHQNLVSVVDIFWSQFSKSGKYAREHVFVVWDYCDAGTLGNLLVPQQPLPRWLELEKASYPDDEGAEDEEEQGDKDKEGDKKPVFLPESFCWHMLHSLVKALAWLHDGTSQIFQIGREVDIQNFRIESLDEEWQPILHRNISPENIFLCHPRRDEWYGEVKLGNYGDAWVSGHCRGAFGSTAAFGYYVPEDATPEIAPGPCDMPVVSPPQGTRFAPLQQMVAENIIRGEAYPPRVSHPGPGAVHRKC